MKTQSAQPLTLPLVLSVIPALVLFGTMIAGFTSLKGDVANIKENTNTIAADSKVYREALNRHEVRLSILEASNQKQSLRSISPAQQLVLNPQLISPPEQTPTTKPSPQPEIVPTPPTVITLPPISPSTPIITLPEVVKKATDTVLKL